MEWEDFVNLQFMEKEQNFATIKTIHREKKLARKRKNVHNVKLDDYNGIWQLVYKNILQGEITIKRAKGTKVIAY